MKTAARRIGLLMGAVTLLAGLSHCSDTPPTTANTVISIELAQLHQKLSKGSFNGLVAVVASWCPPCRQELPDLSKLYRKYRDEGFQIVAVSIDVDGPKAIQPLIDELGIGFPVYWVGPAAVEHYRLVGIPALLVYAKGKLIETLPGKRSSREIESRIRAVMAERN